MAYCGYLILLIRFKTNCADLFTKKSLKEFDHGGEEVGVNSWGNHNEFLGKPLLNSGGKPC